MATDPRYDETLKGEIWFKVKYEFDVEEGLSGSEKHEAIEDLREELENELLKNLKVKSVE